MVLTISYKRGITKKDPSLKKMALFLHISSFHMIFHTRYFLFSLIFSYILHTQNHCSTSFKCKGTFITFHKIIQKNFALYFSENLRMEPTATNNSMVLTLEYLIRRAGYFPKINKRKVCNY
jgi:hypothetical protein